MNAVEIVQKATAEHWRSMIQLCISQSRDENGDIDAVQLEKYLGFLLEEGEKT